VHTCGCLGTDRRGRTWQAAKSFGEPQAGFDPEMSEWGNPAGDDPVTPERESQPRELKHLSTWRKRNQNEIPGVAASEMGRAQTVGWRHAAGLWGPAEGIGKDSRTCLERRTVEGESPVYEIRVRFWLGTRVGRDTRNPG
jgi:hypothetical protein